MKKVAILIAVAVLIVMIAPTMGYEIGNDVIYNVSSNKAEGEIILNITIQAFSYDLDENGNLIGDLHYIENPTSSDILISKDFNVLIIPSENCTIDNIYHSVVRVSEPNYRYISGVSIFPGQFLIVISNPGKDEYIYEGLLVGPDEFWIVLKNGLEGKTFEEMYDIIDTTLRNPYGDDLIFYSDPLIEITPILMPEPTPTPTAIVTTSPTIEPTLTPTLVPTSSSTLTPTPTPIITSTPQPTQTPKQSGYEAVIVIVSLLIIYPYLRKRK